MLINIRLYRSDYDKTRIYSVMKAYKSRSVYFILQVSQCLIWSLELILVLCRSITNSEETLFLMSPQGFEGF